MASTVRGHARGSVFVKNGVITWENQQIDYPSCGPDMPEFEPRGCPRGASFSWYEYSPLRIKYPYVRGKLWDLWTAALEEHQDPIKAWASIVEDEEKAKIYKSARGKGDMSARIGKMCLNSFQHSSFTRLKRWSRPYCWFHANSSDVDDQLCGGCAFYFVTRWGNVEFL